MPEPNVIYNRNGSERFTPHKCRMLGIGENAREICTQLKWYNRYEVLLFDGGRKALVWLELQERESGEMPDMIICDLNTVGLSAFEFSGKLRKRSSVPLIMIVAGLSPTVNARMKNRALKAGISDYYSIPVKIADVHARIQFLIRFNREKKRVSGEYPTVGRDYLQIPVVKRFFDVLLSFTTLLLLSPLLALLGVLIKVESKGPVFYISKRVGSGYNIFNFYKLRTMRVGADKELNKLMPQNQYYAGGATKASFVKIQNDPRVTRVGRFLRRTSLDELPQLINVLKGDMSIVGNRPLPLYEAEKLTRNHWARRFLAPSGITGLWQITKRGKKNMSDMERIELDIAYADNWSFWYDLSITLKTIPALFQKEQV